jgi:hypothetical protein
MSLDHVVRAYRWLPLLILAMVLFLAVVGPVTAASPSPSDSLGGDPRSPGQGPGLVGDPGSAILVVVAIGLVAVGLTLLWLKATGGRQT